MRQSELFSKTLRESPRDEEAVNAKLLIRAGFISKELAGVYSYLPLGLRVIEKIKQIVREEMNAIGGQELQMSSLQRKELWEKTDRWDDEKVDIWFKSKLKSGGDVGLAWSHEEPITDLMKNHISSYRDLPTYVYQFQTKLRNELRVKSGVMRGREFIMKDMYSYSPDEKTHEKFYEKAIQAYRRVFKRLGLGESTYLAFASGGDFTEFSHEFQTLLPTGEDTIYIDKAKKIAINKEVLSSEVMEKLGVKREDLEEAKTEEVGNIFNFGSVKSEQLGLHYKNKEGEMRPVILGSYGIGISRLMGVLVEVSHDLKGIIWPETVSPFKIHLVELSKEKGEKIYKNLMEKGIEVLYDDREATAGEKLSDADLIGISYRAVVSEKSGDKVELKKRVEEESKLVEDDSLAKLL